MTSMYFPAWYLGRNPDKKVILAAYEAEFAAEWGRKVRDLIEEDGEKFFGVKIRQDSKAADRWALKDHSGGMQTVGMGGALLGKGAHLLILDDIQKQEDAFSETLREKAWNWYIGTAYTRLEPGGAIIVVMQRWHEADMVGKILDRAKETGEEWVVYNLPALAEDNDPMGRKRGEALWPEHYNEEYLLRIKATQKHLFSAVYQQRPSPEGGGFFQRSWFKYYKRHDEFVKLDDRTFLLKHCRIFLTVDLAFSVKSSADYTCVAAWAVTPDNDLVFLDVHREQMTGDKLVPSIRSMSNKYNADYCGIEDVQAQTLVVQTARKAGLTVRALKANMDKITRSIPAQIRMQAGQIWFPENHQELDNLETELMTFPNGAHDDLVDVLSYAALEVQRFGPAAIPPEERARLDKENAERELREKRDRDLKAQSDFDDPRWWNNGWSGSGG
jgi:predicted phage terminase large subunit-like protein